MRPAGRAETDSLYFRYPHFDAPVRSRGSLQEADVVIVGAGPVGMTAALTLAHQGVSCVLLDAKATFNDGSRAICIARQSFHILESVDAVAPFLAKALAYPSGRSFYRGRQILEFFMPDGPGQKFRPMYNLQQQYTEAFLHEAVQRQPLIELRWQSRVTAVEQDAEAATLMVEDPHGTYALRTPWLLAADGARSAVRSLRGLRLQGQNYEGRYIIADIQMRRTPQGPEHTVERLALFDPACRPGGTVLVHEQPDHIWRIDYQLRDGEDEQEALREEAVRSGVAGVLADLGWTQPWELEWWSIYSANTLALDDYRDGRIFYVGDSAHIVPIFGVRGLNNGLADAQNIGWKLSAVLKGQAGEGVLDSYTPERRGATMDVFANASKSARFMTPHSRGWTLLRDAALSLALRHPFAGQFANPRNMMPYTYADSPLTTADDDEWSGGAAPGAVVVNAKLQAADPGHAVEGHLSDRLGLHFSLLSFGDGSSLRSASLEALSAGGLLTTLDLDPQGAVAKALDAQVGSAYLIRPDQHVAARFKRATAQKVAQALQRALGKPSAPFGTEDVQP